MLKNNKGKLIVSSLLILLPMLIGLLLYDRLPLEVPVHWSAAGADGFAGRTFVVFLLPLILLAIHLLGLFFTDRDQRTKAQSKKVTGLVFWLVPCVSTFAFASMYLATLQIADVTAVALPLLLGMLFILLGNYLPKCRQNHTIGIKIRATLTDEETWNATHLLAGRLWFVGGVVCLCSAFLPLESRFAVVVAMLLILVAVPFIYANIFYHRRLREGKVQPMDGETRRRSKKSTVIGIVFTVVVLAFVLVLMITGDIGVSFGETAFTVEADYYRDITVSYDAIDSIELYTERAQGSRTLGFASARLLMGSFSDTVLGNYTRYTYTSCNAHIRIVSNGHLLVLSGIDETETELLYKELKSRIEK